MQRPRLQRRARRLAQRHEVERGAAIYEYTALIERVIDGDTVVVDVDLGFRIRQRITCRLDGINAPELRTPEGKDARDVLMLLISGKTLAVHTIKDRTEKYGRYLLVVYLEDGVTTANQWMLDNGHAVPYRP